MRFMPTDLSMAALKDIYQYLMSKKDIEPNKVDSLKTGKGGTLGKNAE